jgi:hypothetical protein
MDHLPKGEWLPRQAPLVSWCLHTRTPQPIVSSLLETTSQALAIDLGSVFPTQLDAYPVVATALD